MPADDFCVVYSGNIVQADILKSVMEGEGIEAFLEDEFIGMIAPYVSPGGTGAVKVLVAKSQLDRARAIVKDFTKVNSRSHLRLVE
jgi:Putative prokaryotic signal transducing protein